MNDIIVSRIIGAVTEDGDLTTVFPGRYPFIDELGRAGVNLRSIVTLPNGSDAAIGEDDYPHTRQVMA